MLRQKLLAFFQIFWKRPPGFFMPDQLTSARLRTGRRILTIACLTSKIHYAK